MPTAQDLRPLFLLDPSVVFLNHGSFGATPKPVFEVYQNWQLELERQPVEFLGRRVDALLTEAMLPLAEYVNADADDMVFVQNATSGVNVVARSLPLQEGDEILTSNHEYGACINAWQYMCLQNGARVVVREMPLPFTTQEAFVEHFWAGVTPKTKVIYLSHITSPTALIFPIEEIIRRAREAGILTVIDGAHAPGQIPLDIKALGADFYTGNCHKWLCAPKGAGFLYARREHQHLLMPLTISWGYGLAFKMLHQMQGTRDPGAYLTVPAAIAFLKEHDWDSVRARCHAMVVQTAGELGKLTGLEPIADESWFGQMMTIPLPACDTAALKERLYEQYRIEVPFVNWGDRQFVRISFQGYNTPDDAEHLLSALAEALSLGNP